MLCKIIAKVYIPDDPKLVGWVLSVFSDQIEEKLHQTAY